KSEGKNADGGSRNQSVQSDFSRLARQKRRPDPWRQFLTTMLFSYDGARPLAAPFPYCGIGFRLMSSSRRRTSNIEHRTSNCSRPGTTLSVISRPANTSCVAVSPVSCTENLGLPFLLTEGPQIA